MRRWYANFHATPEQRARWRLIGEGSGIHWPDVDEDISTSSGLGFLEGWPSAEYRRTVTG